MKKHPVIALLSVLFLVSLTGCNGCEKKQFAALDKLPPTTPTGIAITAVSYTEVKVSWKPSADDSGKIKEYKIYRNGSYMKSVEDTAVTDSALPRKSKFCYRISACDAAGNESEKSTEVCAIL